MNHVLFWNCMAKNGTAIDPKGALIKAIDKVLRFARRRHRQREKENGRTGSTQHAVCTRSLPLRDTPLATATG